MYPEVETLIVAIDAAQKVHDDARDAGYVGDCCSVRERTRVAAWVALAESTENPLVKHIATEVGPEYPRGAVMVLRMLPCSMDEIDDLARREGWCGAYTRLLNRAEAAGVLPGRVPLSPERQTLKQWFRINHSANRTSLDVLMAYVDAILNAERPIADAPTGDVDAVDVEPADNDQPAQV